DRDGRFVYSVGADQEGTALLQVEVRPPERPSYTVEDLQLRTRTVRGDGVDLGRWVVNPYFIFIGELRMRSTGGPPRYVGGQGARVVFHPTGGVPIERAELVAVTDLYGRFLLQARAERPGVVEGRLTVQHPDLPFPDTIDPVKIESDHVDRLLELDRRMLVGPPATSARDMPVRTGGTR
ncbi:MAG: hypothetical protein GWN82_02635, partial [Gemmatimonadetes bacterium]|nr:hypothetical protein [Gemmatimonadota bacterium]NIU29652.1 hypothetical protein [Gemmatimonadota bacterium]NIW62719.1 hypothetical protein [Gemmatimonadota bacterium]